MFVIGSVTAQAKTASRECILKRIGNVWISFDSNNTIGCGIPPKTALLGVHYSTAVNGLRAASLLMKLTERIFEGGAKTRAKQTTLCTSWDATSHARRVPIRRAIRAINNSRTA